MLKICNEPYTKKNVAFDYWSFPLSDFQKYAIESIINGNSTVITAHTGSGKTLPAEFLIRYLCKEKGKKVIYTSPIKALSNEKYWDLKKKFPEISFGIITGDMKHNAEADVLIMTTECLNNTLFQMKMLKEGTIEPTQVNLLFEMDIHTELGGVVFDEIHYINDPDRGHVWEESIMMLPNNVQILGLSATIQNPEKLCSWIANKKLPVWLCPNDKRVVPLIHYSYLTVPESTLHKFPKEIKSKVFDLYEKNIVIKNTGFKERTYENIKNVIKYFEKNNVRVDKKFILNQIINYVKIHDLLPAICFVFSQKKTEEYAECIQTSLFEEGSKEPSTVKDECKKIMMKLSNYREYIELPEYKKIVKLLEKGIAYHHAGVTTVFREMIEILFAKGYIKLLFATETFAVGINMPTRTTIFTSMKKYSSKGFRYVTPGEYTQMSGRAGRRGMDPIGVVFHLVNFYSIQNSFPSTKDMRIILSGKPAAIESKFKINTNIILKLISVNNTNFESFIKESLVANSISKQKKVLNEILTSLIEKKERMYIKFESLRTDINDIKTYQELESQNMNFSRKKRKKILSQMQMLKKEHKTFDADYDWYLSYLKVDFEILNQKKTIRNLDTYIENEIELILNILVKNGFIDDTNTLTLKGRVASNINELHPLAIANILDSKILEDLPPIDIACVLSIFTNLKLNDANSVTDKNTLSISKKAIAVIDKIEKEHRYFYDIQLVNKMEDLQAEHLNNIHYNLCDFILGWWKADDGNKCYKEIEKMKFYGVSLGKIIKAVLKMNNIIDELEKACLIQNNFKLLEKLKEIPKNILKFIATNQSLYL